MNLQAAASFAIILFIVVVFEVFMVALTGITYRIDGVRHVLTIGGY